MRGLKYKGSGGFIVLRFEDLKIQSNMYVI